MCRLIGRRRGGVEVVVDPQGVKRVATVGVRGDVEHRGPLISRIDIDKIQPPALRDEQTELESRSHEPEPTRETKLPSGPGSATERDTMTEEAPGGRLGRGQWGSTRLSASTVWGWGVG